MTADFDPNIPCPYPYPFPCPMSGTAAAIRGRGRQSSAEDSGPASLGATPWQAAISGRDQVQIHVAASAFDTTPEKPVILSERAARESKDPHRENEILPGGDLSTRPSNGLAQDDRRREPQRGDRN